MKIVISLLLCLFTIKGWSNKVYIKTQNDFVEFIENLNNDNTYKSDSIILCTNVDASFITDKYRAFEGYLNGKNFTIDKIKVSLLYNNLGVIDSLSIGGNSRISMSTDILGAICLYNNGTIINCINQSNVEINYYKEKGVLVGGICGSNKGEIIGCKNLGSIKATYTCDSNYTLQCGGIAGYSSGKIIASENHGLIEASTTYMAFVGGICGATEWCNIQGCINYGAIDSYVKYTDSSSCFQETGGVVGRAQFSSRINRCINWGKISNNSKYVGGIAGKIGNSDIYNVINYGQVVSKYDEGYSCSGGIVAEINGVDKQRKIINCINHGSVSSSAKFYTATAAGICATINNCVVGNVYNDGSVSASRVGGTATSSFEIPLFECDDKSVIVSKILGVEDANSFIETVDNKYDEQLLKWQKNNKYIVFEDRLFSYTVATHGSASCYVFGDSLKQKYSIQYIDEEGLISKSESLSPICIRMLKPQCLYNYTIRDCDGQIKDKGSFTTQSPLIEFSVFETLYDSIIFKQTCNVKGVDENYATLRIYSKSKNESHNFPVEGNYVYAFGIEEDSAHIAQLVYVLNGKEFASKSINVKTLILKPELMVQNISPYCIKLECKNWERIKKFNPKMIIINQQKYNYGNPIISDRCEYEFNKDGSIIIDSLQYNYSPQWAYTYQINGITKERNINIEGCKTWRWQGEGIIQLSTKAAMVHALFGGMGNTVDNGGYSDKYDRARFYYRDALDIDSKDNSYKDGVCIDNEYDYAATIPLNGALYQYYISLQYSRYRYPLNNARNGSWQIIDINKATDDKVIPQFYGIKYNNNNLSCAIVQGEDEISQKILRYKVEGYDKYNSIILSSSDKTERVNYCFSSIVPEIPYLIQFQVVHLNGEIYNSPIYRLYSNKLYETNLSNDSFISDINVVRNDFKQSVSVIGKTIVIKSALNYKPLKELYDIQGKLIFKGFDNQIKVLKSGIYILVIENQKYKLSIL